jgi:ATP-grasp domain, R2K clade family 2
MTMPTLLLTPRYTEDSRALRLAAVRAGWDVFRLAEWRVPVEMAERDLVFYGEPLLADVVGESLPYAFLDVPVDWLPSVPARYRGREVRLTTLGEARTLTGQAFFKPAAEKCFPAQVYASGAELPTAEALPDATPVLAQEPVRWRVEYRCFVCEKRVVTHSVYLRDGELAQADDGSWPAPDEESAAALAFAAGVLGDPEVALPPAITLDVGVIEGRGWAIIEANAAWGSGLYGCDPERVLPVLRRASVRRCVARR